MSEADMREKTLADLSPKEKQLLQEAESYLRDKLRNSFEKVLVNCEKLDTQKTGTLDKDAFRTALSRSFACRLTDAEFAVFHLKYHRTPKTWVRLEHRPIDLVKVRGLFHDMMGNNDLEDPATRKRAEQKKSEAVKYVKEQLRLNYKTILRCFRGLDLEGRDSLPLEQFRRVLTRYGAIRFTPDEWWGFSKLVDTNNDGRISISEFESLFQNFDDGSEAARGRQLGDFVQVEHVEQMVAQSFAERLGPMKKMLQTMDLMLRGEIRADHFRRTFIRFGLVLSNPEAEALVAKYTIGDGNDNIDYIRFLHSIQTIIERAEAGGSASPSRLATARSVASSSSGRQASRSPSRRLAREAAEQKMLRSKKPAERRDLTPREQQQLLAAARKTGRLGAPSTARGPARMPVL